MSVAVIGYITPDTKRSLPADRTRGLRFGEGELALHDVLGEVAARRPAADDPAGARRRGLRRGGLHAARSSGWPTQLAGRGVSLIVAGHTHQVMTTRVAGIPILETGAGGEAVGVADLVKTPAGGLDVRIGVVPVDSTRRGRRRRGSARRSRPTGGGAIRW